MAGRASTRTALRRASRAESAPLNEATMILPVGGGAELGTHSRGLELLLMHPTPYASAHAFFNAGGTVSGKHWRYTQPSCTGADGTAVL
eukprot:SAG11_NODE_250_length_11615_cov_25.090917_5_plen_89_part_00